MVVGVIGSSEVIGGCKWEKASSARTKYGWAAAQNELAVTEARRSKNRSITHAIGTRVLGLHQNPSSFSGGCCWRARSGQIWGGGHFEVEFHVPQGTLKAPGRRQRCPFPVDDSEGQ